MRTGDVILERAAQQRSSLLLGTSLVAIALAGVTLRNAPLPSLAPVAPIAFAIAILGDIATTIVLLATWRYSRARRSTLVLALSFGAAAIPLLPLIVGLALIPGEPTLIAISRSQVLWLFFAGHLIAISGALAYLRVRRSDALTAPSRRFTLLTIAGAFFAVSVCAGVAWMLAQSLPPLDWSPARTGMLWGGIGPLAAIIFVLVTWFLFRLPAASFVDRAFAMSMLARTLKFSLLLAGGTLYSGSFYAGELLLALGALFVLTAAIRSLIMARAVLDRKESALLVLSDEASKRAARIRALWEITSAGTRSTATGVDDLLNTATAAIRPGKAIFGILCHLDEQQIVIDSIAWSASEQQRVRFMGVVFPGARFDLEQTVARLLLAENGTRAWDDLSALKADGVLWSAVGWRSFIGTAMRVGRNTQFVTFGSLEAMTDQPFAEDDCAYVDVVGSFFAARFSEALHVERLQFQTEHDALTGLQNRAQFRKAIRAELGLGRLFSVAFVNLDGFRRINERQGHMLGDELLVEIAVRLAAGNEADLVARMNGDEFGILLRGVTDLTAVQAALERYAHQFRTPFHTGDGDETRKLMVGASIGAARFPDDGTSAEELMRRADVALSVAKSHGGSTTVVFDRSMDAILEASHVRLVELADGIAHDQLALVYQPIFDLATRAITGAEALVRWDHPKRGRLAPAEFLPFAERNGLITNVTRWTLDRLIRDFAGGVVFPSGFRVFLNVAAQTLDDFTFVKDLNETLRKAPGLADHLGIEMTETAAMQNVEGSMHTINLLRGWGLAVAIDDFGTGHSSLSYLKQLTVDVIKIDRSFVHGLPDDERDGTITEMLLQITKQFGLTTLAEGIETEAQARWLLEHGCRYGQGYLVGKPGTFAELNAILDQRSLPA